MKSISLLACIQFHRNDARFQLARAEKAYVDRRLKYIGVISYDELSRFERKDLDEDMKEDYLISNLRKSWQGWEEVYTFAKQKEREKPDGGK